MKEGDVRTRCVVGSTITDVCLNFYCLVGGAVSSEVGVSSVVCKRCDDNMVVSLVCGLLYIAQVGKYIFIYYGIYM